MIKPGQSKLVGRAREVLKLDAPDFAAALRRWGEVDSVEALSLAGYERLMDFFTVSGFRDRRRPIVTLATCRLVDELRHQFRWSTTQMQTVMFSHGIRDLRDGDGQDLLKLLINLERYGLDFAAFHRQRREVTPAQVRLLQVARKQIELPDSAYLPSLQKLGGVNSSADLDRRGFALCMIMMERDGFDRRKVFEGDPGFGDRQGFASAQQLRLVKALWAEWSGSENEAALNTWLERFHHVSTLRFLTAPAASKVITALKTMKARAAERPKVSA